VPRFSESIPEVLTRVHKARTKPEKKAILLAADSRFLRAILHGAFHPDVIWEIPKGPVPYKKSDVAYGLSHSVIEKEMRKLSYFTNFGTGKVIDNIPKREMVFIDMLESLHVSEAELLIAMKDKKLDYKGLTYALVYETFPGLLPAPKPKALSRKVKTKDDDNAKENKTVS
jgi:hypothetical protein